MEYYLTVEDHSVTKESFNLLYDSQFDMLLTDPQPSKIDIDKYYENKNYISHTDANNSYFEKVYQFVKSISLKNKINIINNLKTPIKKLLDIGAGVGDFVIATKKNGWDSIGIEPNQNARNIAETKGVKFAEETINFNNNSFDVITMWHVLEHVPNLDKQIKELQRLVKPNGFIIIAVPNFKCYDAKYYKNYWAAYDVPIHYWHFSKSAIKILFEREGFKLINTLPMKFDAYYVSFLSENYRSGKMNILKAIYVGLKSNWKARKTKEYSSHIYILKNES